MTARQQTRGHPMFSYLILVGVASRLVNEFRILSHLLAISSYALCLPAHPPPYYNHNTRFSSVLPFAIRNSRSLERQTTIHGSQYSIITFTQNNHENKMVMYFTYCVPSNPLSHSVRYVRMFGVPSRACRIRMNEDWARVALVMHAIFAHAHIIK